MQGLVLADQMFAEALQASLNRADSTKQDRKLAERLQTRFNAGFDDLSRRKLRKKLSKAKAEPNDSRKHIPLALGGAIISDHVPVHSNALPGVYQLQHLRPGVQTTPQNDGGGLRHPTSQISNGDTY